MQNIIDQLMVFAAEYGLKLIFLTALAASVLLASSARADTVVLKNGDRITGEGCSAAKGKLTIKTDYTEKVELDLSAVEKLIFDIPVTVVFADGTKKEMIALSAAEIAAGTIVTINPPLPKIWGVDISAGYSLNSGNSRNEDVSVQITVRRLIEDLCRLTAQGEYFRGTAEDKDTGEDETVTDRGAGSLQADLFLIEDGYLYGRTEASYDKMKDLDRRIDNGLGLGYMVFRTDDASVDLEAGASYIDSKYDDGTKDHGLFLRLAENGKLKINERLALVESVEYKPKVKDFDNYLINAEAGVRVSLGSNLYFKVSVIDRYDNNPAAGKKRNDVSVIGSLGLAL